MINERETTKEFISFSRSSGHELHTIHFEPRSRDETPEAAEAGEEAHSVQEQGRRSGHRRNSQGLRRGSLQV